MGEKRSDVVLIISDIIFPTSYVVFPISHVVFRAFGAWSFVMFVKRGGLGCF